MPSRWVPFLHLSKTAAYITCHQKYRPSNWKKNVRIYPIGECKLTKNFRAIGKETNRLDQVIFKTGSKISYPMSYYNTYHSCSPPLLKGGSN